MPWPSQTRQSHFNVSQSLRPSKHAVFNQKDYWFHSLKGGTSISTATILNVMIPFCNLCSRQGHYLPDFTCYPSIVWVITQPIAISLSNRDSNPETNPKPNVKMNLSPLSQVLRPWLWVCASSICLLLSLWTALEYRQGSVWEAVEAWLIRPKECVCDCSMKREKVVWGLEAE